MKRYTLRQARVKLRGWTQERLEAETAKAGRRIDQRHISRLELGETDDPSNGTVEALEKALRLPRGSLMFGRVPRHRDAREAAAS